MTHSPTSGTLVTPCLTGTHYAPPVWAISLAYSLAAAGGGGHVAPAGVSLATPADGGVSVAGDAGFGGLKISPSGRYALLNNGDALHLVQLQGTKLLFTHPCLVAYGSGFDADDGLTFASSGMVPSPNDPANFQHDSSLLNLWYWQPGEAKPRLVTSRPAFPSTFFSSTTFDPGKFKGLVALEDGRGRSCILSPDARTWLVPGKHDNHISFELINGENGQLRTRLEMPDRYKPTTNTLEALFAPDSKTLLTQFEHSLNEDHALVWFDVQTGKVLRSHYLPDSISMGQVKYLHDDQIAAIKVINHIPCLQLYSTDQGYRLVQLTETLTEPAEWASPKADSPLMKAVPEVKYYVDELSGTIGYGWMHYFYPRKEDKGNTGGMAPIKPGYYLGARDLKNGRLIHHERLKERPRELGDHNTWSMLTGFPGPALMLFPPWEPAQPWQREVDAWRAKHCNWLPALFVRNRCLFIDPTTGKQLAHLSLPFESTLMIGSCTCYQEQQQSLYLMWTDDDGVVIQTYLYPFHQPWLLILSWAVGVFVFVAGVQWLLRRRLPRK